MNITYDELRNVKHQLPTGSIKMIASKLSVDEQTIRNYFGAKKYENGQIVGKHIQPGPSGGIVNLEDTTILQLAKKIIAEADAQPVT